MSDHESYPEGWWHATVHLNPLSGEIHTEGDHRVRFWIMERIGAPGAGPSVPPSKQRGLPPRKPRRWWHRFRSRA